MGAGCRSRSGSSCEWEAPVGAGYAYTYKAPTPAGEPAATFALFSGTLPPGLALDPATGVLSGTPTTITAVKAQAITFTSTPPVGPLVGDSYQVTATGGPSGNSVLFSIEVSSTPGTASARSLSPKSSVIAYEATPATGNGSSL
jgi:Putative Ig domain